MAQDDIPYGEIQTVEELGRLARACYRLPLTSKTESLYLVQEMRSVCAVATLSHQSSTIDGSWKPIEAILSYVFPHCVGASRSQVVFTCVFL